MTRVCFHKIFNQVVKQKMSLEEGVKYKSFNPSHPNMHILHFITSRYISQDGDEENLFNNQKSFTCSW